MIKRNKFFTAIVSVILAVCMVLPMAACGDPEEDPKTDGPGGNTAAGVSLNVHSLKLEPGATGNLSVTANSKVTWSSLNSKVATVSGDGVVTAVSPGKCVVTAETANGSSDGCVVTVNGDAGEPELYAPVVKSLSTRQTPFIMAMDSSELLSVEAAREASGAPKFRDFDGNEKDVLKILKDNGITDIRIRVWNDPYNGTDPETRQGYGGGNCDVENAVKLSERCKEAELGVIIDFHYSDFWADPSKQNAPKAWKDMDINDKVAALEKFTEESLNEIQKTGVSIAMVQIGNETTDGMAGETEWTNICKLMNAGSKAVRSATGKVADGGAKVAVHFTNAGSNDYLSRAQTLANNKVDYDVFGSSWYPYYTSAGELNDLVKQFKKIHEKYPEKEVMILETGYAWTNEDFDGYGNTALETTTQPITVQGMANAVREVIEKIAGLGDWGLGVSYWGGTWIAASESNDGNENSKYWTKYGCGWATAAAQNYDKSANDGGSAVDNNAFFRSDGTPIEALKVFRYVKEEHERADLRADYIEEEERFYIVNEEPISLPKTIDIVLNSGSEQKVPVFWAVEQADLDGYIQSPGMYTVEGTTRYGGDAVCNVWVTNKNLLTEGSFETFNGLGQQNGGHISVSDMGDWHVDYTDSKSGNLQLYVSNEAQNARIGEKSFHFWDSGKVNFTLYQNVDLGKLTENGRYTCSFEIQGAQAENTDIHAFIKVTYKDGTQETLSRGNQVELQQWKVWLRTSASVEIEDLANVASIEVGIVVIADPVLEGPWGNIDNAQFYFG